MSCNCKENASQINRSHQSRLALIATCLQFYESAIHKIEGGYLQTNLSEDDCGHSELETGFPPSGDLAVATIQLVVAAACNLSFSKLIQCSHQSNTVFGEFLLLLFPPLFLDARRLLS